MEASIQVEREKSVLIIIDVQQNLLKAMAEDVARKVLRNIQILIAFANEMGIPILLTEQYPRGLGPTAQEIKDVLRETAAHLEKTSFSCCRVKAFTEQLEQWSRRQAILVGIETHVCVLQTAADLMQRGYEVHVVADAVCSRRKLDWKMGLRWMEKKGAMIPTTEIIAFQLLKEAGTDEFRRLSGMIK